MKLLLIRHGETVANTQKIIQGQKPGELSPTGFRQAVLLGERLKQERIDRFWSSPLARAAKTAAAIACHHRLPVISLPELMERHFGVLEGESFAEYFMALENSRLPFSQFCPEGGESLEEVEKRLGPVVKSVHALALGETLLITAHSVVNKMLLKILLNQSYQDWDAIRQDNGCLNILRKNPTTGRMEVEAINCTRHLDPAAPLFP